MQTRRYQVDTTLPYGQTVLETDGYGTVTSRDVYGAGRVSHTTADVTGYYHADQHGSTLTMSSPEGAELSASTFEPFGTIQTATGVWPDYLFTGEYRDPTGLDHLRARQHDPVHGRFSAADPLDHPHGEPYLSTYTYASNNPNAYTDPTGHRAVRNALVEYCASSWSCATQYGSGRSLWDNVRSFGSGFASPFVGLWNVGGGFVQDLNNCDWRSCELENTRNYLSNGWWSITHLDDVISQFWTACNNDPARCTGEILDGIALTGVGTKLFKELKPNAPPAAAPAPNASGAIGFSPGEGVSALVKGRLQDATRHLEDAGVLPRWQGSTSPQLIRDARTPVLERPIATFDDVLGGTRVKGFLGNVNGQQVAVFVFKEGPYQGQLATATVPSAAQLSKWGVR